MCPKGTYGYVSKRGGAAGPHKWWCSMLVVSPLSQLEKKKKKKKKKSTLKTASLQAFHLDERSDPSATAWGSNRNLVAQRTKIGKTKRSALGKSVNRDWVLNGCASHRWILKQLFSTPPGTVHSTKTHRHPNNEKPKGRISDPL